MATARDVQDVALTGQLLQARKTLMAIHGARYAERIAPWVDIIRATMAEDGSTALSAALKHCTRLGGDGDDIACLWLLAAGVEALQPAAPAAQQQREA